MMKYLICVSSLIISCQPNCAVTFLIAFPSWLDLSRQYHYFDLAFKSPINTIRNGLSWHKHSKFIFRFSMNSSNLPWAWLGDLYKERFYCQYLIRNWNILADIEHWELAKAKIFCNRYKHQCIYCWNGDLRELSCTLISPNYHHQK